MGGKREYVVFGVGVHRDREDVRPVVESGDHEKGQEGVGKGVEVEGVDRPVLALLLALFFYFLG